MFQSFEGQTHVECFFGRAKRLWTVMGGRFRWAHDLFDDSVDLCILLTNEHIKRSQLTDDDAVFVRRLRFARETANEQRDQKRRQQQTSYRARRRQRF